MAICAEVLAALEVTVGARSAGSWAGHPRSVEGQPHPVASEREFGEAELVASHGASARRPGRPGSNGLSLIDLAPRGPMASAVSEAHGLRTRPQQARGLADAVIIGTPAPCYRATVSVYMRSMRCVISRYCLSACRSSSGSSRVLVLARSRGEGAAVPRGCS